MIDEPRFECRRDAVGTWMVWDRCKDMLAKLADCKMQGCDRERAHSACAVLNKICDRKLETESFRSKGF
jgi:hypothetical protein